MKRSKGFTLIELMVVIVILGILSAVIAPRIPQFVNKAKEGRTKGNLATLRSTMNIYYSDNDGFYPIADPTASLVPKYLKKIPDCETVQTGHGAAPTFDLDDIAADDDFGYWGYVDLITSNSWGDVWIECSHTDLSSKRWTSY
jgi:prepilin-type N-terminal cleavage/methylation domain-containing protein